MGGPGVRGSREGGLLYSSRIKRRWRAAGGWWKGGSPGRCSSDHRHQDLQEKCSSCCPPSGSLWSGPAMGIRPHARAQIRGPAREDDAGCRFWEPRSVGEAAGWWWEDEAASGVGGNGRLGFWVPMCMWGFVGVWWGSGWPDPLAENRVRTWVRSAQMGVWWSGLSPVRENT